MAEKNDKKKILNRLKNIMDLIKHPNTPEDERNTALVALRKLMVKYDISENEIPEETAFTEIIWEISKSMYKWEQVLGAHLGQLFGYAVYKKPGQNCLIIACKNNELDTHAQVFYSVRNQIIEESDKAWKNLESSTKSRKEALSFKRAFRESAGISFILKLKQRMDDDQEPTPQYQDAPEEETQTSAIVINQAITQKSKELSSWFEEQHSVTKAKKSSKKRQDDFLASTLGHFAGLDIEASKGLESE